MWICLSDSFLSIVDKGDPSGQTLLVRARSRGDIEKEFPSAQVIEGSGTDYAFRARISRKHVAERMAEAVQGIGYANFKSSVSDRRLHNAYARVWGEMAGLQDEV